MPVRRISGAVVAYIAIAVAELAAVLIISGGGVSIAGVTAVAMEVALLSPEMRRHVASRGLRLARR